MNHPNALHVRAPAANFVPLGRRLLPGLILSAAVAVGGLALGRAEWLQSHGLSGLTLAIVLGMVVGNTLLSRAGASAGPGVQFARQSLLRLGVVLYGLRLTLHDIAAVGLTGVLVDALVMGSTFALAWLAGTRLLGLERRTAMLIGAGSSICGAAAVLATEPIVRARAEQVTIAVSTVVLYGTIATLLYPVLHDFNAQWQVIPGGATGFGIYAGSTIHEVAQVVAAGRSIGADVAGTAVIAKMVRVMLLAPFLVALAAFLRRERSAHAQASTRQGASNDRLAVPWFAFAFIGVVLLNSLQALPAQLVSSAIDLDTLLLAMAMGALGMGTRLDAIRSAGFKPLLLGLVLFGWLVGGGALINRGVAMLFS